MSLKKKLLTGLLAAACAAACAFGVSGCFKSKPSTPPEGDNPQFETAWTNDNDYHWHAAVDGSDNTDGKAMHEWKEQTDKTVAATCAAAGRKEFKCSVCDATKEETTAQLAHVWSTDVKTVDATCTTAGYQYKQCTNSGCNVTTTVKYIQALGHEAPAATCTAASVCTRADCGVTVAPALGHEYAVVNTQEATCTTEGKVFYECSHEGCNEKYDTVTSAAKGHKVVWAEEGTRVDVHTADVCYEIEYAGHCSECEFTDTKKSQIKDHVFTSRITTEATCSADGVKTLTCSCSYEKTETIKANANAHKWDAGTTEGSITTFHCAEDGTHTKTSVVYSDTKAEVPVDALKQTGEVKLANTTIALDDGVKNTIGGNNNVSLSADTLGKGDLKDLGANAQYVGDDDPVYNLTLEAGGNAISDLGGEVTVTVPYELGPDDDPDHIVIWYINGTELEEIEGTYSNGFVTFKTNHFSYYTVTRMTPAQRCAKYGHNYKDYSVEPNCLLAGYELSFCTRCGDSLKVNLPAKGHDWQETATPATCTAAGKTHYECKNCEVEYDVNFPATGHLWTATEYVDATCTAAGHANYKCENCTETYSVKLAQIAHPFKTTLIEATCTEGGHKHNVCLTCGLENDTDYVEALGHDAQTKVVAPTCTVEGFTLKFCGRCNEELEKSNVVAATGHNMAGGACSVCGYGCNHNYVAGNKVEVTCTEDGYVQYTCSNCQNSYKGEIQKATGHQFGLDECVVCGTENPAAREYYLNLVDTAIGGSVRITLTDLTYKLESNEYEGEELVETKVYGEAKQLDVTQITLAISPTGEITGSGEGSISVTIEDETVIVNSKLAVEGGKLYALTESDAAHLVPSTYMSMDFDYALRNMTNGALNYQTLRDYVRWYNTEVNPVLNGLINANSVIVADVLKFALNNAFIRTETAEGYNYVLDYDAVARLNEKLYTTKVSALADKLLGEGFYAQIPTLVTAVLNMTPEQALEYAAKCGLDKDQVCAAIDSFMLLMGQEFDSAAMLEQLLSTPTDDKGGTMKDMSVAEFIIMYQKSTVTKADFIAQTVQQVTAMADSFKDATVYDIIATATGMTADDLYNMVSGYIGQYVSIVQGTVYVSFATDKAGNVTSANIKTELEDFVVSNSGSGNTDAPSQGGSEKPVSDSRNEETLDMSANVQFTFGDSVTVDKELIASINAAKLTLEKNAVITAYSNKDLEKRYEYEPYPNLVTYSRGREMKVHTDARGNVIKVVVTEQTRRRSITRVYGNFFDCYENLSSTIEEYEISTGSMVTVTLGYCGKINAYSYFGTKTRYTEYSDYRRVYRIATDELISDTIMDRRQDNTEQPYDSSVTFYYNPETKAFTESDPHYYETLKVDESKSEIKCGGYYYMVCEDCGFHYNSSIYHLDDEWYNNYKYELVQGANSCTDGVIEKQVCRVCEQTVRSYTSKSHLTYKIGEIDLTEYGAKCGHTINVYGCACGYERYTHVNYKGWYDKYDRGQKWDSIQRVGNYTYGDDGKDVTLYRCTVTDCAFNFAFYTTSKKDSKCWATYYEKFIFDVDVDENNRTVSGGTLYEKFGNVDLVYMHDFDHKETTVHTGTDTNFEDKASCADCGLKVRKFQLITKTDSAARTTEVTEIRTYYKSDANDNTVKYVEKRVSTTTSDANGNEIRRVDEYSYYDGEMDEANLTSVQKDITIQTFDANGVKTGGSHESLYYGEGNRLNRTEKTTYKTEWVEGNSFNFNTEYYWGEEYFDKEDNPSETPMRWYRRSYDYSKGYCSPVVKESTQAGESEPREEEVEHCPMGEYVTEPTCTQQGTRKCAFCKKVVQSDSPYGHSYENGVCHICGLENHNDLDGRVALEDLSYTSETDYVIGYFNREAVDYKFVISIINLDAQTEDNETILPPEFAYTDSNADIAELNYRRSGKISFAVAAIAEEAKKMNVTNYMIRVTFVSERLDSALDYSITIDVHKWAEGKCTQVIKGGEPQEVTLKYCTVCGLVHGVGYIEWNVQNADETTCVYIGYKNDSEYTLNAEAGKFIESVEVPEAPEVSVNGIVLNKNYTLFDATNSGTSMREGMSESDWEQFKTQYTLIFNSEKSGVFCGTAFTYDADTQIMTFEGENVNAHLFVESSHVVINIQSADEAQPNSYMEFYFQVI